MFPLCLLKCHPGEIITPNLYAAVLEYLKAFPPGQALRVVGGRLGFSRMSARRNPFLRRHRWPGLLGWRPSAVLPGGLAAWRGRTMLYLGGDVKLLGSEMEKFQFQKTTF